MEQLNIKEYFESEKKKLREACPRGPRLMIIDPTPQDKGNQLYVKNKLKDFAEMGWKATVIRVTTQKEYEEALLEAQLTSDAIIVQRPAIAGITLHDDDVPCLMDADGLHPQALVLPATVRGIVDYLDDCGFRFEGHLAVVLGRSKIVGKPMADELLKRNMTVCTCHSWTAPKDVHLLTKHADLIVSAVGKPAHFTRGVVHPDAIVIDVGINYVDGKIVGDFIEVPELCWEGWSTPVPGGVGLLTRLGLMKNCVELMEL